MIRSLIPLGVAALWLAGCSTPPPVRFVPGSTVFRADPQPTSLGEFREAERQGYLVAATGYGPAYGVDDLPVKMQAGERLHVLRVMPDRDEVLVQRLDYHTLARVGRDGWELRGTTFPDRP